MAFLRGGGGEGTLVIDTQVSNNVRNSNDAEVINPSLSYIKKHEMLLNADLNFCRVRFDMLNNSGIILAYSRIYKNGVAIGLEHAAASGTYVTYAEDFSGWVSGDLIQLYTKIALVPFSTFTRNMRFSYDIDDNVTQLGGRDLVTPLVLTNRDPTISVTNQNPFYRCLVHLLNSFNNSRIWSAFSRYSASKWFFTTQYHTFSSSQNSIS